MISTILRVVSAKAPYYRGGLQFAMIAGRSLSVQLVPLDEVSDIHLEQLIADPNIDVSVAVDDTPDDAPATLADRIKRFRAGSEHTAREAALIDRERLASQYLSSLDVRAAALDTRQAAIEAREAAHQSTLAATLRTTDAVAQGAVVAADRAAASGLADVVLRNRDEAVDHHAAANTPVQHLDNEITAGLVEVEQPAIAAVEPAVDEIEVTAGGQVDVAPAKPKRAGGRFARTAE